MALGELNIDWGIIVNNCLKNLKNLLSSYYHVLGKLLAPGLSIASEFWIAFQTALSQAPDLVPSAGIPTVMPPCPLKVKIIA